MFVVSRVDLAVLVRQFRGVTWSYFLAAFILSILSFFILSYAWQRYLSYGGFRVPLKKLMELNFVGLFFSSFTPAGLGGDVSKAVQLTGILGQKTAAAYSVILTRVLNLVSLIIITAVSSFYVLKLPGGVVPTISAIFLVLLGSLILIKSVRGENLVTYLFSRKEQSRIALLSYAFLAETRSLKYTNLLTLTGIVLIFQLVNIYPVYLLAKSLSLDVSPIVLIMYVGVIRVVVMLPVTINGIGLRESAYAFFFTMAGFTVEQSVSLGLISYLNLLGLSLLGGAIYPFVKSKPGGMVETAS